MLIKRKESLDDLAFVSSPRGRGGGNRVFFVKWFTDGREKEKKKGTMITLLAIFFGGKGFAQRGTEKGILLNRGGDPGKNLKYSRCCWEGKKDYSLR